MAGEAELSSLEFQQIIGVCKCKRGLLQHIHGAKLPCPACTYHGPEYRIGRAPPLVDQLVPDNTPVSSRVVTLEWRFVRSKISFPKHDDIPFKAGTYAAWREAK